MPDSSDQSGEVATDADFDLGRTALLEITSAESIGAPAGSIEEGDGVVTVYFDTTLPGYPGWRWTVSISHVDGEQPGVLETELTPGDTSLLSPAWIPWVDRLADYRAAQDALGAASGIDAEVGDKSDDDSDDDGSDDDDDDDDDEDDEDDDDDDGDDLGSDSLHGGDLDGVDIDDDDDDDDDDDELDVPAVRVEDADEAEGDSDDTGPQPPAVAAGDEWGEHDQEHDKSY